MKNILIIVILAISASIAGCTKDSNTGSDPNTTSDSPSVTGFSPVTGTAGTTVTITGKNFSSTISADIVKFNGSAATISSATSVQIIVTVPSGATTGKITVTVGTKCATSADDFTVSTTSSSTYSQSSGTVTQSEKTYSSSTADLSAVKVAGGTYSISSSTISSTGNTSSSDNSSFYGLNAVVLAYGGNAVINSTGNIIASTGKGANGIFAYGTASITSTGDKFSQAGDGGHAIMCSGGGTITVKNDTAITSGASSSTIATDRGGGTITVTGGTYKAEGSRSAAIYSTGTITCTNAALTATGAEALVIEGSNYIALNNCTTKCTNNKWGSLIYQSMSGDASGADGHLTITGGSFTYTGTSGGMFYNTNSTAHISLNNVTLVNGCDTLVRCIKGSWGASSASSGGITYLTTSGQAMSGLIYVDASSSFTMALSNSSVLTGKVNPANVAGSAKVTMDATSTWTLTGNSYLTSLTDAASDYSNITAGSFSLYVNGIKIK